MGPTTKFETPNRRITTFAAPPRDFNPVSATANQLAVYGIPRRPDAVQEPGLRKLWDRAFSRPVQFIQAELVEDKVWRTLPHGALKPADFGLAGNWAGGIVEVSSLGLNPTEPATMVFAEWVVPTISTTPQLAGSQTIGFWVGLGGWGTSQVLQAGTAATVNGNSVSWAYPTPTGQRPTTDPAWNG